MGAMKHIICPCCGTPEEDNKSLMVKLTCDCEYHSCLRCGNGKCTKHCGCTMSDAEFTKQMGKFAREMQEKFQIQRPLMGKFDERT